MSKSVTEQIYEEMEEGSKRSPRRLQRYPPRKWSGVIRHFRSTFDLAALRQRRPRLHARPWKLRSGYDYDAWLESRATKAVQGSLQERIFYQALVDRGFIPETDFVFQLPELGGRSMLGGLLPDFVFPVPRVIVQVQSVWHTLSQYHKRRDDQTTLLLEKLGYQVLEIWADEIEDENRLDEWINRYIMKLWGTHHQNLGTPGAPDFNIMEFLGTPIARHALETFYEIKELIIG